MFPPCPHCGAVNADFTRNVRPYGWCVEIFDEHGEREMIETSNMRFTDSQKISCGSCGDVRKDVMVKNGRVVETTH